MAYKFGREVTVKLPEPDHASELPILGPCAKWFSDNPLDEHFPNSIEVFGIGERFVAAWLNSHRANLNTSQSRALGLALLAAADYAERGET